jgi:REP element-mobilizing transposase RayT
MWNLPPPPGFQGLREGAPLDVYVRHLPHWRQDGATYFVTFRQADSLPQNKLHELEEMRRDWERRNPKPHSSAALEELARHMNQRIERWLDQGLGSCVLKDLALAEFVTSAMHHFDGQRYELGAYVVMPNHVHAVARPMQRETQPLETILKSWKQYSSKNINPRIRSQDSLWQEESFDRIIRDEEHLDKCLQYIGRNPQKAGLPPDACPRWVRPDWVAQGWTFREP